LARIQGFTGFCNTRSNPENKYNRTFDKAFIDRRYYVIAVNPIIGGIMVQDVFYISNMQPATIEKTKPAKPCNRLIDLGNGVEIPVKNETEARFIVDMMDLAKLGKVTLPKSSTVIPIPDNTDIPSDLDWRSDYEYSRSDRF